MDKTQAFSLWYVLAALVVVILVQELSASRHTQTLSYSEFKQALAAGKLDDVLLAGRVTETLVFQDVSAGAENDLHCATGMARHMVTHCGMSETLGLAICDSRPTPKYLGVSAPSALHEFGKHTAEVADTEVLRLLDEACECVTRALTARRATPDRLAQLLLEKEVVDRTLREQLMSSVAREAA